MKRLKEVKFVVSKNISVTKKSYNRFNIILVLAAFAISVATVLGGAYVQEGYNVKVGDVSGQRFKSPKRIENFVATEKNRLEALEASKKVEPVTERDTSVNERVNNRLIDFFAKTSVARENYENYMKSALERQVIDDNAELDSEGLPITTVSPTPQPTEQIMLPIFLNETLTHLIISMNSDEYSKLIKDVDTVIARIYEDGIQEIDEKFIDKEIDKLNLRSDMNLLVYKIITSYLEPNIIINEEATKKAKEERASNYEKVFYEKGQTIVDEGQIITEEAYHALDSLSLVKNDSDINIMLTIGAIVLVVCVFILSILYLYFFCKENVSNRREALLLFTLYVSVILITWLMIGVAYQLLPILIFTMLVAMLFNARMSIVLNIAMSLICMLIYKGDLEFLTFYLLVGLFISFISRYTTERRNIIVAGLLTCIISVVVHFGVSLFFERAYTEKVVLEAYYSAIMGISTVVVCIGTAPFWEAVFGIVTSYRLIDLSNPNSHLLRKLAIEAPGTYHHSLIVANLSESAAYEIGANPNLARAGGYYHDIGKLKYPQYFSENQVGENSHNMLDPRNSVQVIVSHVTFGIELATKYKIPIIIRDVIEQHHGNTLVKFFYYKAKELKPAEEINEEDFRYPYSIPQSKEAALVMLADTVEAAVRSMIPSGKTMIEVEEFVRKLIRDKLDDGQLLDSGLTIKDLETVVQSFLRVFKGMYHERIPYPDDKDKK